MSGQEAESASADRVTATRRIAASAHAIFLLVSDPARHVDIDGSGMLQAAPDARPLTEVGQTFDMDMDRRPLGDIPNMAEYKVHCTVTRRFPDRLMEWTVQGADRSNRSPTATAWSQLLRLVRNQRRASEEVRVAGRPGRPVGALARQPHPTGRRAPPARGAVTS